MEQRIARNQIQPVISEIEDDESDTEYMGYLCIFMLVATVCVVYYVCLYSVCLFCSTL